MNGLKIGGFGVWGLGWSLGGWGLGFRVEFWGWA